MRRAITFEYGYMHALLDELTQKETHDLYIDLCAGDTGVLNRAKEIINNSPQS